MASMMQPWLLLCTFFVFLTSTIPFSACQSDSPRNIETFYPFESPPVSPIPTTPNNSPVNQEQVQSLLPPPPKSSSSNNTIAKAVAATAASTLVFAGLCFFFIQRWSVARQRKRDKVSTGSSRVGSVAPLPGFDGNLKGLIVDENGLDVVYWRKLEGIKYKNSYRKEVLHNHDNEEEDHKNEEEDERGRMDRGERNMESEHIQEAPLLGGKSSASEIPIPTKVEDRNPILPKTPPLPPPLPLTVMAIPKKENPAPPPPPITPKKNPLPPPPPPKSGGSAVPPRPLPAPGPIRKQSDGKPGETPSGVGKSETGNDQVKLKPLHWEKVNASADHSMVWHKLDGGSFTFDGDLMEALFGSVAGNRKSPQRNTNSSNPITSNSVPAAQIFILESRKSQNTAIVLRSLTISRKEILDALIEGQGLNLDTLEKLTRIAPTKEEESQIIAFSGDPTRLADAESFLYHLLKAVPTAFPRLDAMFFRSNYVFEILHLKEFIQTLESGCKELRTRGLFLKLLEAVLKSGNRMNAGTARGNAQAFNLTALRKLSDVKSTDGKTTLLHFVVEEVVRSEGKRCVLNRNHSLTRSSSSSSNSSSQNSENSASKEEREKEYIKLGLPAVGGLSAEFSNVKKAAMIDHDGFAKTCSVLTARLAEIQQIVAQCASNTGGGGGFVREMNGFIESAEGELKEVREEQTRVMELVKKTTEYYQAASLKDKEAHPLLLFVIVKDFLGMVDHVCVDIARNMQKRRTPTTTPPGSSSSPKSPAVRSPVKFPILPEHFMSDKSSSTSSESSDDD